MMEEIVQVLSTSLGLEMPSETRRDFWADGSKWSSKVFNATQCSGKHLRGGLTPESCGRPRLGGTACSHVTVMHCAASVVSVYSTTLGYMNTSHILQSLSLSFALSLGLKDFIDSVTLRFFSASTAVIASQDRGPIPLEAWIPLSNLMLSFKLCLALPITSFQQSNTKDSTPTEAEAH